MHKNLRRLLLAAILATAGLLAACAGQNTAPAGPPQKEVQFLDSAGFDRKLSSALSANQPEVTVLFPAAITLNNIPERMDKWLSKVEKFGNKVEIQPEPEQGRELLSTILSLFIKAYDLLEEAFLYAPAKNYDVRIYYRAKTGLVTRMVFQQKGRSAAAAVQAPAPAPEAKPAP